MGQPFVSYIFLLPSPIFYPSLWYLGLGAIFFSITGFIGGILSFFKPRVGFVFLIISALGGLPFIFTGYLLVSLLLFGAGILALLEHRKDTYNLNLRETFFPEVPSASELAKRLFAANGASDSDTPSDKDKDNEIPSENKESDYENESKEAEEEDY